MRARIVIGANFGDEGKGLLTDYLCAQGAGVVVRFNGGAQAGHTVVTPDNERHVFHHFGSGSLLGVPTFLSQFFVCNPILFFKEYDQLVALGYHPDVYAHPDCLVTTLWDMLINQVREEERGNKRHGSCGVGFHETITRSTVPELKITLGDIWNGGHRLAKQLDEIAGKFFTYRTRAVFANPEEAIEKFIECCNRFAEYVNPLGIGQCKDPVFEGAQGLLLDQDNKEYFPHVTHSKTGMANVETLCAQAGITDKDIYYVSRTYLTRHGAGRLPKEDAELVYEDDTNAPNQFQGSLRFAQLDTSMLRDRCKKDAGSSTFKLVLTHCDQYGPTLSADLYSEGPMRVHISSVLRTESMSTAGV